MPRVNVGLWNACVHSFMIRHLRGGVNHVSVSHTNAVSWPTDEPPSAISSFSQTPRVRTGRISEEKRNFISGARHRDLCHLMIWNVLRESSWERKKKLPKRELDPFVLISIARNFKKEPSGKGKKHPSSDPSEYIIHLFISWTEINLLLIIPAFKAGGSRCRREFWSTWPRPLLSGFTFVPWLHSGLYFRF